ncbi:MAG: hypothetical protein U0694_10580 [Anaerolineae bacterium]
MTRTLPVILFFVLVMLGMALLAMSFAEQLPPDFPIAIDWQALHRAIRDGHISYEPGMGMYVPPWNALVAAPLGFLSMRASWALVALFTMVVLLFSVPRTRPRWRYYAGILLLEASFPALRHAVDGNFEGMVIAGILLALSGYRMGLSAEPQRRAEWYAPMLLALGVLLASAKPQLTLPFLAVLGLTTLYMWRLRRWLRALGFTLLVVLPCMLWIGQAYLTHLFSIPERGSIMDIGLTAALNRMQLPSPLVAALWLLVLGITLGLMWLTRPSRTLRLPFSRERAGVLIAAGLLLSPYSAGNSMLTLLAVGIIPLFLRRPLLGLLLIVPIDLTVLVNNPAALSLQAYYTTAVLLLCWGVLGWRVWKSEQHHEAKPAYVSTP